MIDLRQLQALSAVAAEGSVARAAIALGWSQPTVDYHLKNLDRLVGTELTVRSTRGSKLTAAGALMLERGEAILSMSARALTDVQDLATRGGVRLRFGTFPSAAAKLLPGIAHGVKQYGIELDTTLEELRPLVTRVNQHTLDAALIYAAEGYRLPLRSDVHTTELFTDPMLIALNESHALAGVESFDLSQLLALAHDPWVMGATPGDPLDELVLEVFASNGTKMEAAIRTDEYAVMLGLVAAGMGVALVPSLAVAHNLPRGVVVRPVNDTRFARELMLAAPAGPSGPTLPVRQLAEAVRQAIREFEPTAL